MSFHVIPLPESCSEFWDYTLCSLVQPHDCDIHAGDIVQFAYEGAEYPYTRYFRQVVREFYFRDPVRSRVSLLLAPLNLPLMRQVELYSSEFGKRVFWVASKAPIKAGEVLHLEGAVCTWLVTRAFTSLRLKDIPVHARVGVVSKVI